ncbi:MAG: hypothetical protein WEE89_01455 [Gemmatimonadota bacterium]
MRRLPLHPILLGLVLAGCSTDSATDPLSTSFAMVATPFSGRCALAIQPPTPISPGIVRQIDIGTCPFTHLGLSTYISDKVINFITGTQTLQNTYIAANGDRLYANGSGTNQLVAPGRVAFSADVTFAGGTGRFSNATGSATVTGEADLVNARSKFTTSGTIAY